MNKDWLFVGALSLLLTVLKITGFITMHWIWTTGPLLGVLIYFGMSTIVSVLTIIGPIPVIISFLLYFVIKHVIITV